MEMVAFGWIVLEMTDSPWMVAIVGFARSIPFLVFGFVGGSITERFGRQRVIVFAQSTNVVMYGTILLSTLLGTLAIWQMVLASLVLGSGWALDWPARRALIPDLVGKQQTVEALLLENFVQGSARIFGPLSAGAMLAFVGAAGCMAAICLLSLVALGLLLGMARRPVVRAQFRPSISPWTTIGGSLRYVGQNRPILGVMLVTVVVNLLLIPYMTLLPVFAAISWTKVLSDWACWVRLLESASSPGCYLSISRADLRRTAGSCYLA